MTPSSDLPKRPRWSTKIPVGIKPSSTSRASPTRLRGSDWGILALVLVLALIVRLVFYTGPMGSDDAIYTEMAVAILHGDWTTWNYAGATRYGINLPVAGLMALFGSSEFTANLWALLCAIGEVATVFVLANRLWGRNAAVLSALVLGILPLHVNLSGRLLADTPLTFFVTLCFTFFFFAEQRRSRWLYLAAGLALGAVYWVKESVAVLVVPVFLAYALIAWTFRREWLWMIAGSALMLVLSVGFLWWISGDPWLIIHAATGSIQQLDTRTEAQTTPVYYFKYLFLDARHTWLMPFLAVGGIWTWWRSAPDRDGNTGYVALWALGLLIILSFAVVSLSPFQFIPKQTNYMQIFAAPLSLLAGYWLASRLKQRWMAAVLVALVAGSLVLCAMEQQVVRVFVANSRAAMAFQATHADVPVFGSGQANSLSSMRSALDGHWPSEPGIRALNDSTKDTVPDAIGEDTSSGRRSAAYAIVDLETSTWGKHGAPHVSDLPSCWKHKEDLVPLGFGIGRMVLGALRSTAVALLPDRWAQRMLNATEPYYRPRAASVYEIPVGCRFQAGAQ